MNTTEIIVVSAAGFCIWLWIMYALIKAAVKSGAKEQNSLIQKQNDILVMMLNKMGVDKDELIEIFLQEKKALWTSLKNHKLN